MGIANTSTTKRYASPTSISVSISTTGIYISSDNPAELEKRFFDTKVSLSAHILLPDGAPPIYASKDTTIANLVHDIDKLLQDVSRIGVEVDEGV